MCSSQLSNFLSFTLKFFLVFNLACFTSNPQSLERLHLDGDYVPIFPTGFLGFRITRRPTKIFVSPRGDSVVTSCLLFSVPLSDGIKRSGS